jgi:hypothetical protein
LYFLDTLNCAAGSERKMANITNKYAQTASFLYNNSAVETSLLGTAGASNGTLTFGANTINIGDHIFVSAAGLLSAANFNPGTLELKLKFAGASVSTGAQTMPLNVNTWWRFHGMIACRDTDMGICIVFEANTSAWSGTPIIIGATPSLNRGNANTIDFTSTFSVANTANQVVLHVGSVELRPGSP